MTKEKKKIAVRMCSGCVCEFDRKKILDLFIETFADNCEFKYSYALAQDADFDLVLLINGCDSECAKASVLTENLVIDHNNKEDAVEIYAERLEDLITRGM